MLARPSFDRGDTLIEVLFAVTVFALVVVSALSIMNQGTATSQRSLEMSLVTQQIENQAETLRFLHESYVTNYQQGYATSKDLDIAGPTGQYYKIVQAVIKEGNTQASNFGNSTTCATPPSGSFVLNTRTATVITNPTIFQPADTYAQLQYDSVNPLSLQASRGVWIEGVRSPVSTDAVLKNAGFIDFHIRGCWDAPGLSQPLTFGTIVRLYEPRG